MNLPGGGARLNFDSESNLAISTVIDYYVCLRALAVASGFCGNMTTCASDKQSYKTITMTEALSHTDQSLRHDEAWAGQP